MRPSSSSFLSHVGGGVDTVLGVFTVVTVSINTMRGGESWYIRKGNLETLLNLLKHLLVVVVADKRDRQTLRTETTGTADTVKVGVGISGKIVVDCQVDTLDINTTAENIGGNTNTLVEFLEFLVAFDTGSC